MDGRSEDWRSDIISRLVEWSHEALTDEDPPRGVAREILEEIRRGGPSESLRDSEYDLHSLWSAVTALTQEVKLQGRSFGRLSETLSSVAALPDSIDAALGAREEALSEARVAREDAERIGEERDRTIAREAEIGTREEVIDVLIDLRDRLERSLSTARANLASAREEIESSWVLAAFEKRSRPLLEAAEALDTGYVLSLERIEETLRSWGVSEIPCTGRPFDPEKMKAVDVETSEEVKEGTVLETYRTGYEWRGRVIRYGEVKVARATVKDKEK